MRAGEQWGQICQASIEKFPSVSDCNSSMVSLKKNLSGLTKLDEGAPLVTLTDLSSYFKIYQVKAALMGGTFCKSVSSLALIV